MPRPPSGLILVSGGHVLTSGSFQPQPVRLMVRIGGLEASSSPVKVLVWENRAGFPWDTRRAQRIARIDPGEGERSVVFMGLAPGRYAVTAFADPDNSGRLARDLLGRPAAEVYVSAPVSSLRRLKFSQMTVPVDHSTIIEMKPARPGFRSEAIGKGKIHDLRPRERGKPEPQTESAGQSGEASGRR